MGEEMFTENNTVEELLAQPGIDAYFGLFCPADFLEMLSAGDKKRTLKELRENVTMPWGLPFPSDLLLQGANQVKQMTEEETYHAMALWSAADPSLSLDIHSNTKSCVSLLIRKDTSEEIKPAVIICPGGGYNTCASYMEGVDFAEKMAENGYRPFVLNYRVKPNRYPIANIDLALAIKYVRANADFFHIDPQNLMLIGSSAGGHLVGMAAVRYNEYDRLLMEELRETAPELTEQYEGISVRPDKVCMNYPLVSFADKKWTGNVTNRDYVGSSEEELREVSLEYYALSDFPKSYVWICEDDDLIRVPAVIRVVDMLKEAGVECLFHLYPTGNHGCGRATGTSAEGWLDEMIMFMK